MRWLDERVRTTTVLTEAKNGGKAHYSQGDSRNHIGIASSCDV